MTPAEQAAPFGFVIYEGVVTSRTEEPRSKSSQREACNRFAKRYGLDNICIHPDYAKPSRPEQPSTKEPSSANLEGEGQ